MLVDDNENNHAVFEYLFQVVAKNSMGFGPESGEVKAKKSGIGETSNDLLHIGTTDFLFLLIMYSNIGHFKEALSLFISQEELYGSEFNLHVNENLFSDI